MDLSVRVADLEGLGDRLMALADFTDDRTAQQAIKSAMRKAMQPALEKAKATAPTSGISNPKPKRLKDSLKLVSMHSLNKITAVNGRIGRVSLTTLADPRTKWKAWEAEMVGGKDGKLKPFLRPSLYQTQGSVVAILARELGRDIEKKAMREFRRRERST